MVVGCCAGTGFEGEEEDTEASIATVLDLAFDCTRFVLHLYL